MNGSLYDISVCLCVCGCCVWGRARQKKKKKDAEWCAIYPNLSYTDWNIHIFHNQYEGHWCPGDRRGQSSDRQDMDGFLHQIKEQSICAPKYNKAYWRIHTSGNWVIFVSVNGLLPVWPQAITWNNADLLSIGSSSIDANEISIQI